MSLTNYYSTMGLQSEERYGAHLVPGGLQGSSAICAEPSRQTEGEDGTTSAHITDFSHFSNKQTSQNVFSPWTNTSTPFPPQPPSTSGPFRPHHLLSAQQPYYGPQTQTHVDHVAPLATSEGRLVRCWEGDASLPHVSAGFHDCARCDLSNPSQRIEGVKPETSAASRDSPEGSRFDGPAEVALERLRTVEEREKKSDAKKEDEEKKAQLDPGTHTRPTQYCLLA